MTRFRYNKRKRVERMDDLPLTPLVDTALTLLIVFIIAAPAVHNGIKIDLPQGSCKEDAGLEQKITLIIDEAQDVYLGTKKIDVNNLYDALDPALLQEHKGIVYIQADKTLSYGFIFDIVDRLRGFNGVAHVVLVSKK